MQRLTPIASWSVQGDDGASTIDARVLPLLRAIVPGGSLAAAARICGVPYRTAWAAFDEAERVIGAPLLTLTRGRGASPTPLALRWLAADSQAAKALESAALGLDVASRAVTDRGRAVLLRIAASHDIALAQLKDRWRVAHSLAVEFHGSAESLQAYRSGRVELAGFHVATTARGEFDPLLAQLDGARDAVIRFLTREQGLIVARGNPQRIRGIADLVAKRATIVNRQPGPARAFCSTGCLRAQASRADCSRATQTRSSRMPRSQRRLLPARRLRGSASALPPRSSASASSRS